ncbi:hypothetical protein [Streptantibioticus ferralitis]|uniref:Uncharacterized protein n=1 Tax=Streptantibioticus ferralitis TaxID=236510 RepID=A0ABT5ZBB1_9ACTN|nr:hypothetical protein [Streptantibioticus ferralitis]MDF2260836.1 hypothetical protein [Streptantibioticus ferralitis]
MNRAGLGEAIRSLVSVTTERCGIPITYTAACYGPTPHDLLVKPRGPRAHGR